MEKDKKMNKLPSGLALLLSGFPHLAACGNPCKKIHTSKPHKINTNKYTNRKLNNVLL